MSRRVQSHVVVRWFGFSVFMLMALLAMAAAANARMPNQPDPATGVDANAQAIAVSGAVAVAGGGGDGGAADARAEGGAGGAATATQNQTAVGGQGGAGGDASNLGNAQNVTIQSKYERQAPSVFAPPIYASGPCAYGWSAGASIPGGGASFGRSKPDTNCDRRELARVLTPLNPYLALKVLCADPLILKLYEDSEEAREIECTYHPPEPVAIEVGGVRADIDPRYATKDELDRAFKQALVK